MLTFLGKPATLRNGFSNGKLATSGCYARYRVLYRYAIILYNNDFFVGSLDHHAVFYSLFVRTQNSETVNQLQQVCASSRVRYFVKYTQQIHAKKSATLTSADGHILVIISLTSITINF